MKSAGEDFFEEKKPIFWIKYTKLTSHLYKKKTFFLFLFIFILSISHCQGLLIQSLYMVCDCIV